jgi:light-harvesting complex I chlorophyll a/b binding protein 1
MAATVGTLVQETNHFSGFLSTSENLKFEDVPNGLGALSAVPLAGWVQIIGVLGLHEILIRQRAGKAPGNYGTGYLGLKMDDQSSAQLRALSIEISNGRLAMLGILGMWASEIVNGQVLAEVKGFGL